MLSLSLKIVEPENRDALLSALKGCVNDDDLNGKNGEEYLWADAKESGFGNNLDYIASEVKNIPNDTACIVSFFEYCYGHDVYYQDYKVDTVCDEQGNVTAFSVAYITEE